MLLSGLLKTRRLSVVVAAFLSLLLPAIASGYRVYIFRGGDADSAAAVAQAIEDRGHNANLGIAIESFDGTQVRLADFDAVVILDNTDRSDRMAVSGRSALRDFLLGGGRVIADGNFMNYYGRGDPTLGPVLPASWCGSGSPRSASLAFTQVAPTDPIVHNGMPASFTFSPDGSYLGVCLSPTAGARTFYLADTFQNGKPTASLVGRVLAGGGQSIGYSTLIGLISLQSADFKRLFVNVVEWAAPGTTTSPGLLAARPATLSFNYQIGGIAPAAQSISVTSSGAAVSFGAAASASDGGWLSISPASGTTPAPLKVSANPPALTPRPRND